LATATNSKIISVDSPDPLRSELIAGQLANLSWTSQGFINGDQLKISISLDNQISFVAIDTIPLNVARQFHGIMLADTLTQMINNVYFKISSIGEPAIEGIHDVSYTINPSYPFGAISLLEASPFPLDTLGFQILFNEEVFNIDKNTLNSNGTILSLEKSIENPSIWTGTVLPADTGSLTMELPAGLDNLGNLMQFLSLAEFEIAGIPNMVLSTNVIDCDTLFFYRTYVKSYELDVTNYPLTEAIQVTPDYPIELSLDGSNWSATLDIPEESVFPVTVYTRIDTESDDNSVYDVNIIHQTALADNDTLNLKAIVIEGPPIITISAPEGDVLNSLIPVNVSWTQYGVLPDKKYISISFDNAQSFMVIDSIIGNETPYTYEFSLPDTITQIYDQVFFRVSSESGVTDISDVPSTIIESDRIIWNGSEWIGGTPPNDGSVDVFVDGTFDLTSNGVLHINDLAIGNNAVLTVSGESALIVDGDLINNGEISIGSGSTLITYETGIFSGNPVEINRNSRYAGGKYSFMGIPVEQSVDITGNETGGLAYQYDETIPYGDFSGQNRWVNAGMEQLIPGRGYAMAFQKDFAFSGKPNTGTITYQGTYTEDTDDGFEGWNLVANPYAAAIKIQDFLTENSQLTGAIYIWDDNGSDTQRGTNADYIIANGIAATQNSAAGNGNRYNQFLGTSQGFFVKLLDETNTNIDFTESMRYTGNNSDDNFFRQQAGRVPFVRLNLINGEHFFEQTIVGWVGKTSDGEINRLYDATVFDKHASSAFYSLKASEKLAIRGVNYTTKKIPLGLTVAEAGNYENNIDLGNYTEDGTTIMLVDDYHDSQVALTTEDYLFYSHAGTFDDRFYLLIENKTTNVVLDEESDWYFSENKIYQINRQSKHDKPTIFNIITLSGRVVKRIESAKDQVLINEIPKGVYVISDGTKHQKIIIR